VRDLYMVNPPLRVIINALPWGVRKFIVFPISFGYDERAAVEIRKSGEAKECHTW